jgi:hypothetical protein
MSAGKTRGFRPLASTFFRALIPTQSASCFIASRSETNRLCAVPAVRRTVLRGSGWAVPGRAGVRKG